MHDAPYVLAEVGAGSRHLAVDAGLHFALEETVAIALRWPAALPGHLVTHKAHRAACLVTRWVESEVAQQHEGVHCGVPPAVPRCAAPLPVGRLEGDQARPGSLLG